MVLLAALMARGVSFEYQRKFDDPRWRSSWRWALTIGSALIPLLLGVGLGDLLHGLPINSSHEFTGNFFDLLTPFGLWSGLTLLVLSLLMGATYLTLKTTGELHERAQKASAAIGGGGHGGHLRVHDLDPRRPQHGLRAQADRGLGPHGRHRRRLGRPGQGGGLGLHRGRHRHRRDRGVRSSASSTPG